MRLFGANTSPAVAMGRALFSTLYTPPVAVRTEADAPPHSDRPKCEKWSISNPFDPDSDEFCEGATREVFTDTEAWRQEQEAVRELLAAQGRGSVEGSSSDSESDAGSPMAVGSDDPAQLFADAFHEAEWLAHRAFLEDVAHSSTLIVHSQSPCSSPQASNLRLSTAPDLAASATSPPESPTFRRIPAEPAEPRPPSPAIPPHVYSWHVPLPAASTGPLTNPAARLSFVMLNTSPVRVRIQNTAAS
ncbi:hypothetical protein C0992_007267 [Termitomyces sp. T32_za158]|nr:hypothetical protein C0992_007267 [Termitomyces sp. T32_za158]